MASVGVSCNKMEDHVLTLTGNGPVGFGKVAMFCDAKETGTTGEM